MRVLITGALGHIGSRLIRELPLRIGSVDITMMDNLETQRHASLYHLPEVGTYRFVEADLFTAPLEKWVANADVVVHLAAHVDSTITSDHASAIQKTNLQGTQKIASACAATGASLIFPSSTSVYSVSQEMITECCSASSMQPTTPYSQSKVREEQFIQELSKSSGLKACILRFGSICGVSPGMRFQTAINKLCWMAATNQPLTVWRTAVDQKRPYADLRDAVNAILWMIERSNDDALSFNVATAHATITDILEVIRRHRPDIGVSYVDHPVMNNLSYSVSCQRIQELGFEFQGNLEESIGETISLLNHGETSSSTKPFRASS